MGGRIVTVTADTNILVRAITEHHVVQSSLAQAELAYAANVSADRRAVDASVAVHAAIGDFTDGVTT